METIPKVIDSDVHIYEGRNTWLDRIEPRFRDRALRIVDDERGFPWLVSGDRRLHLAEVHVPGRVDRLGDERKAEREWNGRPPVPLEDRIEPAFRDPVARLARMDAEGVDAAICFPNYGLLWEDILADDLPATCANMAAYNTWIAEIVAASRGRLFGVSHLSLRDHEWAEREIARMASAGVRLAMIGPNPVDGKPLAHPDLDRLWACFQDHDVAPVFHVSLFQRPLHPAWYEMDPDPVNKVMDMVFLSVAPAAAVTNLIIHGKLEQFPRLRLGIMELTGRWVPEYLLHLDGGFAFYQMMNARPLTKLPLQPSQYFRRQVRVGVFGAEGPLQLIDQVGDDIFMWCSDYPHAEGLPNGLSDYRTMTAGIAGETEAKLFGGNAAWLLFGERGRA